MRQFPLNTKNPREAAFLALWRSLKQEQFVADALVEWRNTCSPTSRDYHLAMEIGYGSCRMANALDYLAKQHSHQGHLKLKRKEKVLAKHFQKRLFPS